MLAVMLDRRGFLSLLAAAPAASKVKSNIFETADRLAQGGLGVVALDRRTGRRWELRPERRFQMASVYKLPLAAYVWDQIDRGTLERGSAIFVEQNDLRPGPGSTEAQTAVPPLVLAGRAVRESDNTAAYVLLKRIGGAKRLTAWLENHGFDIRVDTGSTTPAAMGLFIDMLAGGNLVGAEATASIMAEMQSSRTGRKRIRAGLPAAWIAGDKTGTEPFEVNDVAFMMPAPTRSAVCVAAFIETRSDSKNAVNNAEKALAAVGRALAAVI